ncbi:MAG: MBL fold metallo-hydrolase [Hyphomicrobiales bacterium]
MNLTLTILGCSSSGGVPRVGGSDPSQGWGACDPENPKNRRRRCSILLTLTGSSGTTFCVVDTGPDFREQMIAAAVPRIDGVVYTHEHADHIHGIDDLRPFALIQRERIKAHMDETTFARAFEGFAYCFETPTGSSYPPIADRQVIDHERDIIVSGPGGDITLTPIPVVHGESRALGLRIGNVLYLPDVSAIPEKSLPMLNGLDCLILDALRYKPHVSHFNVEQAVAVHEQVQPKRTVLTNLHIDLDYETLNAETPEAVEPAYDGLKILIG